MMDRDRPTRRDVLAAALGVAGLMVGASGRNLFAQGAGGGAAVEKLADDLFVIRIPGETNVVAQVAGDGVVLVDGVSTGATDALMKAVAALPGAKPVQTLFNTHWHPEHTGANEVLGKSGKTIIAHENTRLWLAADVTWPWNNRRFKRLPKVAQPNKTFYTTGQLSAPSAGTPERRSSGVNYGYIPDCAHTDGDLYVHFPNHNVLAVGDVMSGQGWPVVDYVTGGWIGGLVGAHQRLQTLADAQTRIVPARGPVLSLADVKAHTDMYSTIYDRLSGLLNKGRSPSEAVEAKPTKEFDAKMGDGDEFVRRAFESLWGYLSPDA